jgi:hypothetical protein
MGVFVKINLLNNDKGHAVLEFSLSLFFLFTLTAGIVDFGNILNQYTVVAEAAHQGARFASGISFLKTNGELDSLTDSQLACPVTSTARMVNPPPKEAEEHTKIQQRVDQVLALTDRNLEQDSLCITSALEDSSTGGTDKNVVVKVEVAYQTILYGRFPINATARAPFLQN